MGFITKISEHLQINLDSLTLDGTIKRFGEKKRCWAVGHKWSYKDKDYHAVYYGDWSQPGSSNVFKSYEDEDLTKIAKRKADQYVQKIKHTVKRDREQKHRACAQKSSMILKNSEEADSHGYLERKGIPAFGTTVNEKGLLQVPIYKNDKLAGLQYITAEGKKWFETGSEIDGSFFPLAKHKGSPIIVLAEGLATAASVQMATEYPVLCCFNDKNMVKVARSFQGPMSPLIVACCDRDKIAEQTGLRAGEEVATMIEMIAQKSVIAWPWDDVDRIGDFNDLHVKEGLGSVKQRMGFDYEKSLGDYFEKAEESGFTDYDPEKDKVIYQYHKLLEYMITKTPYHYFPEMKEFYIYNGAVYRPYHEQFIRQYAQQKFVPSPTSDGVRTQFLGLAKAHNCAKKSKLENRDLPMMAFKNGVADFSDPENPVLLPHSPEYFLTETVPHNLNVEAECPTYDQLLKNILEDQDLIDTANEFLGWCLSGTGYEKFQKFLVFDGGGENGKSTLCNVWSAVLGHANVSAAPISKIEEQRFLAEQLIGSMLNISEEEPPSVFKSTGTLKKMTGGSVMNMEPKNKAVLTMKNKAKIIITYNEMPEVYDTSKGFKRRLAVIPFRFDLKKPENRNRMIPNIYKKLETEYEGIIKRAMEGYIRLNMRGDFLELGHTGDKLSEMYSEGNELIGFVKEMIEISADSYIFNEELCRRIREAYPDFSNEKTTVILKKVRDAVKVLYGVNPKRGTKRRPGRDPSGALLGMKLK